MTPPRKPRPRTRAPKVAHDAAPKETLASGAATALVGLAHQLRSWTDSVLGIAGAAADVTMGAAKMMLPKPGQRQTLEKTGAILRRMRESAGMSVADVGTAIDLKDPVLLDRAKTGDKVKFAAEQSGGAYIVTRIESTK